MRYFTKEMWAGWQHVGLSEAEEDARAESAQRDFERRARTYWKQLDRLRGRLDASSFRFFRDVSMHDGRVIAIQVTDDTRAAKVRRGPRAPAPPAVTIEAVPYVSLGIRPPVYRLRYRGVRRLVIDFPSDRPLFPSAENGFGDWGYDELTAAGRYHLRHEILFSSGATFLVECGGVAVRKVRNK